MTHPDQFPDNAVPREELRSLFHDLFGRLLDDHPDFERSATQRASEFARAFVEFSEGADVVHPALPTLESAVRKLIFVFTNPEDISASPTDEDIASLLMQFYEANDENLQATADNADTYANYMPYYAREAQVEVGDQEIQMTASEWFWHVQAFALTRMQKDFQ